MDLWQVARIILRRFYVFLPIAVAAFLVASATSGRINPEYTASASAIVVGPAVAKDVGTGELQPINPYLNFSGSLSTTAQAIPLLVGSSTNRAQLRSEGLISNYFIGSDNRSPLITITAGGPDPDVAMATVERVVRMATDELQLQQERLTVPADSLISLQVLSPAGVPTADTGGRDRVQMVIVAIGLAVAAAASIAFEVLAQRRRRDEHSWDDEHERDELEPRQMDRGRKPLVAEPHGAPVPSLGSRDDEALVGQRSAGR